MTADALSVTVPNFADYDFNFKGFIRSLYQGAAGVNAGVDPSSGIQYIRYGATAEVQAPQHSITVDPNSAFKFFNLQSVTFAVDENLTVPINGTVYLTPVAASGPARRPHAVTFMLPSGINAQVPFQSQDFSKETDFKCITGVVFSKPQSETGCTLAVAKFDDFVVELVSK